MDSTLYSKLLNASFRYISIRPRSIHETSQYLINKLKKWHVADDGSTAKVLERLIEMGYLDDAKFALWLVESRRGHKPKGEKMIRYELKNKGVDGDTTNTAIQSGESSKEDEISRARKAIRTVRDVWGRLPKMELRRKLYAFLLRRGFNVDIAQKIIDEPDENS